jgi:K+-transporting ATPase A subunit
VERKDQSHGGALEQSRDSLFVVGGVTPLVDATLGPSVLTQPNAGNFSIVAVVVWLSAALLYIGRRNGYFQGFWTVTEIQILALATPIVIVAIAFAHTSYILHQKPPAVERRKEAQLSADDAALGARLLMRDEAAKKPSAMPEPPTIVRG